jgi:hypothetical protein
MPDTRAARTECTPNISLPLRCVAPRRKKKNRKKRRLITSKYFRYTGVGLAQTLVEQGRQYEDGK